MQEHCTWSQQQRTSQAPAVRLQGQGPSGWYTWFGITVLLSGKQAFCDLSGKNILLLSKDLHTCWILYYKSVSDFHSLSYQGILKEAVYMGELLYGWGYMATFGQAQDVIKSWKYWNLNVFIWGTRLWANLWPQGKKTKPDKFHVTVKKSLANLFATGKH